MADFEGNQKKGRVRQGSSQTVSLEIRKLGAGEIEECVGYLSGNLL